MLDLLYPPNCMLCGTLLEASVFAVDSGEKLCASCKKSRRYIQEPTCMRCGKRIETAQREYCFDCEGQTLAFERNCSVYEYDEQMKKAMYELKYKHQKQIGVYFGEEIARVKEGWIHSVKPDVIIPIPVHKKREKQRGYNQAQVMGNVLSRNLGIPIDTKILMRTHNTKAQKELGREERKNNMKSALKIGQNAVQYDRVLLVDDIYTTGATLDVAAQTLKEHGVKEVYCVTACIGKGY